MRGHIVSHPKSAEVGVPFLIEVEIENTRSTITQVRLEMRGLDDSAYAFNPLQVAAKTRLAKIYLNDADYDQVISLFESSDELTSTMYELKGDAEKKLGQSAEARMSYMLALQTNTNQASKALINMKISDLEGETFE